MSKNLATCTPLEFLKQTSLLKKALASWLEAVQFTEIRSRKANLANIDPTKQADEIRKQAKENLLAIVDKAVDEYPEKTLEILAIACFVDPADVNNHPMSFYLKSLSDMIEDDGVISFFISLSRLGNMSSPSLYRV